LGKPLESKKQMVQLHILEILSKNPGYSDKDISNALRAMYMIRCDYRTVRNYRAEVEQLLAEIEARVKKSIENKMSDKNLLKSIWSRLTKKAEKAENIRDRDVVIDG